jgi:hypothetical protein
MPFEIKSGAPDIPPGSYKAQLASTEVGETDKWGGSRFHIWHWLVEVPGKDELVEFSDSTGLSTSPGSKTYLRLEALTGSAPKIGETVDDPVGKTVMLTIGKKANGFPEVLAVIPYQMPLKAEGESVPK